MEARVIAAAPTEPVRLEVVSTDDVRAPLDRFRCVLLSATLTGASCVGRQHAAEMQERQRTRQGAAFKTGAINGNYSMCRECEVGQGIRRRLAS